MKKSILIFWIAFLLSLCITAYFQVTVATKDEIENSNIVEDILNLNKYNSEELNWEQSDNEKKIAPFKKKGKSDLTLKNFYHDNYNPCEEKLKKFISLNKVIDDYIHRYVNLFLRVSLLKNHYVSNADEIIKVNLEISVTGEDLAFLQEYSNSSSTKVQKNLLKLDAIMMNIIKMKEKTIIEKNFDWIRTFSENFYSFWNYEFLMITILVLLIVITLLAVKKFFVFPFSLFNIICIVVNIIIIFEGWWTYKKKLKEKEVELYVNALNKKKMPNDCDPSKITWYESWYNYFFDNDCLTYYQNLSKVATDEVSIYQCIYDTYALYLVQKPFNFFGKAISDFNNQVTDSLPWFFKLVIFIPVSLFTVFIIAILFLILCGNRLKISFFGSSLEVGRVGSFNQSISTLFSPQFQSQSQALPNCSNNSSNKKTLKGVISKPRMKNKHIRAVSAKTEKFTLKAVE